MPTPPVSLRAMTRFAILTVGSLFSALVVGAGVTSGIFGVIESDYPVHFGALLSANKDFSLSYSFFYFFHSFITPNLAPSAVQISGAFIVGAFFAVKGLIITYFAISSRFPIWVSGFFALMLIVVMPFPTLGLGAPYYLGTLSPNVFHSATQVLANALAIPAVYCLVMWFNDPSRGWTWAMGFSGAVASLAKPAITPAWLITLGVLLALLLAKKKASIAEVLRAAAIAIPVPVASILGAFFLTGAYWVQGDSGYTVAVGHVWSSYVESIPLALLRSWAFPLVVVVIALATLGREFVGRWLMIPWTIALVAAGAFWLFAQRVEGELNLHGNLAWAGIAATSALYTLSFLCVPYLRVRFQALCLGVLLVQGVGGLLYLNRWLSSGSYY